MTVDGIVNPKRRPAAGLSPAHSELRHRRRTANHDTGNPSIVRAVREGNPKKSDQRPERMKLELVSSTIQPNEVLIVGQRIRELLNTARKAAPGA